MKIFEPSTKLAAYQTTRARPRLTPADRLLRILADYLTHYHRWRCQQSLELDCPEPRPVQLGEDGEVVEIAEAGGLYLHYERRAA